MIQQRYTNGIGAVFLEQVANERQIAQRLAHLLAILVYQTGMHPETRERHFAREVFGLRDLARVMRKREIGAATVDVDLWAKVTHRHRSALDMPAGATWTPGTWPGRFTGSLRLPEHKIERVLLARIIRKIPSFISDSKHGCIIVQANCAGHDTELRILLNAVVDATLTLIRVPTRQERLDNLNHRGSLLGSICIYVGAAHVQRVHITQIPLCLESPQLIPGHTHFTGLTQDIIIDIGHILHVVYGIAAKF